MAQSMNFVFGVLFSIENIKLASEWKENRAGLGGTVWKNKFHTKCFQYEYDDIQDDLGSLYRHVRTFSASIDH